MTFWTLVALTCGPMIFGFLIGHRIGVLDERDRRRNGR